MTKVIDTEAGRILGPNEVGEVCFKSDFIMKGYYKNPEETKKSIDSEGKNKKLAENSIRSSNIFITSCNHHYHRQKTNLNDP